jgi:hypothetical protein
MGLELSERLEYTRLIPRASGGVNAKGRIALDNDRSWAGSSPGKAEVNGLLRL